MDEYKTVQIPIKLWDEIVLLINPPSLLMGAPNTTRVFYHIDDFVLCVITEKLKVLRQMPTNALKKELEFLHSMVYNI